MTGIYLREKWLTTLTILLFLIAIFLSTYKLTESPPIWMDEGMIVQTSKNLAERGIYSYQVGPNDMHSPSFISTSYPVTFPVALSFYLFGTGLFQARIIMVLFILLLCLLMFVYIKNVSGKIIAICTMAIMVSFPPLYGHGKNVLGEIPGLFYSTMFLLGVLRLEKNNTSLANMSLAGFFAGLAISTKPIFILFLPAMFVVGLYVYFEKKEMLRENIRQNIISFLSFLLIPILFFLFIQFSSDSIASVFSYYANPYKANILANTFINLHRFVSESQPIYFLILFVVWTLSLFVRYRNLQKVYLSEALAHIFSFLVFLAYFRTPGYYRYFFLSQFYSLIFFPTSLYYIFYNYKYRVKIIIGFVFILTIIQAYQLIFNSWVSRYYYSTKTRDVSSAVGSIPPKTLVMFYQTPELVLFFNGFDYYQYTDSIETEETRRDKLSLIKSRIPEMIFISSDMFSREKEKFVSYKEKNNFDRYLILDRK